MTSTICSWAKASSAAAGLDLLARVCLDLYLLSRVSPTAMDGRDWEKMVGVAVRRPELTRRQGPGLVNLWDRPAASGAGHEIDQAAAGPNGALMIEAKASGDAVTKAELAHFHTKTFDFYCEATRRGDKTRWWRLVASAAPPKRSVRALSAHFGLILCDPAVLPLPVLLRAASKPSADQYLPEPLLREAVRLFEPSILSLNEIWTPNACSNQITFSLDNRRDRWTDDLLYIQQELSDAVLDLYDRAAPGRLLRRTSKLLSIAALPLMTRRTAA